MARIKAAVVRDNAEAAAVRRVALDSRRYARAVPEWREIIGEVLLRGGVIKSRGINLKEVIMAHGNLVAIGVWWLLIT